MIRVKGTTKGMAAFQKKLASLQQRRHLLDRGPSVTVGIHQDAVYPDGTPVAHVAAWNEFGTTRTVMGADGKTHQVVHTPERSFIRSSVRENEEKTRKWRAELVQKIGSSPQWTTAKALDAMGFRLREVIRNKIKSNVPPPNAPRTLAAKRLAGVPERTLMFSEHMLNSVTYQVHES